MAKATDNKKKYEVTVVNATGECAGELFKKMAVNGDITAEKIMDNAGKVIKITGYAECHIVTAEKEFDVTYYATADGYYSTGSEIFRDSVDDYLEFTDTFKIQKVKTSKGSTYKAVPISNTATEADEQ